jgi:peptidoglycan-N-acetylglucosamine deacetylase
MPSIRSLFFVSAAIGVVGLSLARAQQPGASQPGTQWSEAQLREAVDLARVGRKLTPKSWPNGSRVAVCLSFDADSEAPLLRDGTTSPTALSAVDFGAQSGVPRNPGDARSPSDPRDVLRHGHRRDASSPIAAIQKSGRHEIGVHGWIHETPTRVTAEEEERLLDQAIEYLTRVTGKRPLGYRAPSWAFSRATLDLIQKKGFLYDSSLQALDEPYEIESRGKPTGIVELPIDWTLTQTPFLGQNGRMPNPAFLYQLYKDEFDGAYQERTMFVLTLHPYLSGHRAPMQHLEQFVTYIKSKPGVWFATAADIARHVKVGKP